MAALDFLKGNVVIVGLLIVTGYLLWKFVIQPIMNEGKPIEPEESEEPDNLFEGMP